VLSGLWILISAAAVAAAPTADAPTWRWYVTCPSPAVTRIHVTLRGRPLLDATVPVCRVPEGARSTKAEGTVLEFHFRGDPSWFDTEETSVPGTAIEGNIWQAGGETYGMLLGVAFVGAGRVLLNTVHIAQDGEHSSAPVAKGVVVSTSKFRSVPPVARGE
jgi:hypothetical protein